MRSSADISAMSCWWQSNATTSICVAQPDGGGPPRTKRHPCLGCKGQKPFEGSNPSLSARINSICGSTRLPQIPNGAVSMPRRAIGSHVIVEQIVRHLCATYLARLDVEPVVNATPDAAVSLVIAELKKARVRLREHDRVTRGVPRGRKSLRVTSQHVRQ